MPPREIEDPEKAQVRLGSRGPYLQGGLIMGKKKRRPVTMKVNRNGLRTQASLSQRQLAKLVGTTASVICRLEDADYEGHSLAMLNRIAAALNRRVEIRFVSAERRVQSA